jgi:hypothetical protein
LCREESRKLEARPSVGGRQVWLELRGETVAIMVDLGKRGVVIEQEDSRTLASKEVVVAHHVETN